MNHAQLSYIYAPNVMFFDNMEAQAIRDVFSKVNLTPYDLQISVIQDVIQGKHVFVNLPTGFGKSAMYAMFPLVMDKVRETCRVI